MPRQTDCGERVTMKRVVFMVVVGLIAATGLAPVAAHQLDDLNKVVVLQCQTETDDGNIEVSSSGVTTAAGVTINRGQRCATAIASLLQAGMIMQHQSTTFDETAGEVSFNFVFLGHDASHVHDDDDSDDEDDEDSEDEE